MERNLWEKVVVLKRKKKTQSNQSIGWTQMLTCSMHRASHVSQLKEIRVCLSHISNKFGLFWLKRKNPIFKKQTNTSNQEVNIRRGSQTYGRIPGSCCSGSSSFFMAVGKDCDILFSQVTATGDSHTPAALLQPLVLVSQCGRDGGDRDWGREGADQSQEGSLISPQQAVPIPFPPSCPQAAFLDPHLNLCQLNLWCKSE